MAKLNKKELYAKAQEAEIADLPAYDDITGPQLEELLGLTPDSDQFVVVNNRKNPVQCAGLTLAPMGKEGDRVALSDAQLNDGRLMPKVMHGIKTGVFKKG